MISLFVSISQLLVKIIDKLSVDQRINVLPELVKDEPVSQAEPAADGRYLERALGEFGPGPQQVGPHRRHEAGDQAVSHLQYELKEICGNFFFKKSNLPEER